MSDQSIEVIAAVVRRQDRFLICRRPIHHERHGGLWEFPGGKIEPGETLVEAARRELSEELKLSVIGIGDVELSVTDEASGFVINFVAVETSGVPELLEHIALEWLTLEELFMLPLAPSDRQYVEHRARMSS